MGLYWVQLFHGVGTAIGALVGFTVGATSALLGYKTELEINVSNLKTVTEATQEYIDKIKEERSAIEEKINSGLAQQEYYTKLAKELENLVDVNGKVKAGYEDRVKFILNQLNEAYGTEYEIVDGVIQKYDELKNNIYEVINAEKAKILLEANEEAYANAIKRTAENQAKLRKITEEKNRTQESSRELVNELIGKYGSLEKAESQLLYEHDIGWQDKITQYINYKQQMEETQEKINELTNTISTDNKTIIYWEDLKEATITGNADKINTAMQNLTTAYTTEGENQEKTLLDQLNAEIGLANARKKIWEENGIEINDTRRQQLETGIRLTADKLIEQTNTVETLGEDEIEAWRKLAEGAESIYNEKISNVDEDTRLALEAILGKVDINSPEFIEKMAKMASESETKYNRIMNKIPEGTREKIQGSVDAINGKVPELSEASNQAGSKTKTDFDKGLGDTRTSGVNFIQGFINGAKAKQGTAFNILKGIAEGITGVFNKGLGNASPSKKTRQSASYFMAGFTNQIDKLKSNSLRQIQGLAIGMTNEFDKNLGISNFANGIKINPDDFKINANQFIDYGQISGAISTQSNVNVSSDIEGRIENAIYKGLSNATIPVEIEATTDEGIIFKKVQTKAKEFAMQTGENPFPSLS